jgi:hypothetical protein
MFETNELSNYLAPNERVVWQGQGKRRMTVTSAGGAVFIAMFVVMALVFGVVFLTMSRTARARSDDATVMFIILPIILLSVGLGVGIPLLIMGQRASKARYFVTTSSALILYPPTAWSGSRLTVLPLKNLQQITLSENRDGTGTLTFGQSLMAGYGRYSSSWLMDSTPSFSNIEQPHDVYQLIRKQMTEA